MEKNITIAVLLVVVVALGGYILFKNNKPVAYPQDTLPLVQNNNGTPTGSQTQPSGTGNQTNTPVPSQPTIPAGSKQYSDGVFGYSFIYPQTSVLTTDTAGKITLAVPGATTNPTVIEKSIDKVDAGSGKFGPFVISYGATGWIAKGVNEIDGSETVTSVTPTAYTNSGLPIFTHGNHGFGMYAYIVALSHTKFLWIYGSEDGVFTNGQYDDTTDSTFKLAKTVKAI